MLNTHLPLRRSSFAASLHRFLAGMVLVTALAVAPLARADLTHEILSFVEVNASGYLIDSDASNADPKHDRDAIDAAVEMRFARSGVSGFHYLYRFDFQLLNADGVAQILNLGGGSTGTTLSIWEEVDMTAGPSPITRTITGRVRASSRLNPGVNYQVKVTVARRVAPSGTIFSTGLTASTALRQYIHFNQLISGDTAYNVVAEVTSTSWTRPDRVQTDPNRDFFRLLVQVRLHRYDGFAVTPVTNTITSRIQVTLRDDLGNVVPLQQSSFEYTTDIPSHFDATALLPKRPATASNQRFVEVRPVGQLASRTRTYTAQVTVGHFETPGAAFPIAGVGMDVANTRLLDFNGTLAFAGTSGSFTSIANPGPTAELVTSDYVQSTLRIQGQSGSFQGFTFGTGEPWVVRLRDNGVATLFSGTVVFNGIGTPANPGLLPYDILSLTATSGGLLGTVRLQLPAGLGVTEFPASLIHEPHLFFTNVGLSTQLQPQVGNLVAPGIRWVSEESKPFIFETAGAVWDVADGRLRFTPTGPAQFVRSAAYHQLLNDAEVPAGERFKLSNDGYFWNLQSINSAEVVVTLHPDNGSARLTTDLIFGGSLYRAHFPSNALISFSGGEMRIVNDRVDPTFGGLTNASSVTVPYRRDCPDGDCGGAVGPTQVVLHPTGQLLRFTRDGGLVATGPLSSPLDLRWGWVAAANAYAQRAFTFSEANFHAAGIFLAGSEHSGDPLHQATRLLLTGVALPGVDAVERPGSGAYKSGLGDYAGINLRATEMGSHTGQLTLAGQTSTPFPLTNRVKYYLRRGGINGIHEAVNGQFPATAKIYGVDFTFETLGWGFLDSEAVVSRTDGGMEVPYPSDFTLAFKQLMIDCQGALLGATIDPSDTGLKQLAYWEADFRPLALSFEGPEDAACDPANRRLVLGVEAYAGGIPQVLSGRWGFRTNGNLVTSASGDLGPEFDSRLRLPNRFALQGPDNQTYEATPVGKAYLNDHAAAPDATGWMNLAAYLDIPFFSDLEVHIHTTARLGDEDPIVHLMGGYPDQGFQVDHRHFFNETFFDVGNRGLPQGVSLANYRGALADTTYRPRARTRWLGVVDLDYPLNWRPASRSFVSHSEVTNNFLVLSTKHQVDYLSADFVDISFGANFSTLPKISIANLVADQASAVTGKLTEFLETAVVNAGVKALDELLDVKQREFFELVLNPAIDAAIEEVLDVLRPNWHAAGKAWANSNLDAVIGPALLHPTDGLAGRVRGALTKADDALGFLQAVDQRLATADLALSRMEGFLAPSNGQPLGTVRDVVLGLAQIVSGALDKPEFAEKIQALIANAQPRLAEVAAVLGEMRSVIATVRQQLGNAGQIATQMVALANQQAASVDAATTAVRAELVKLAGQVKTGTDSFPAFEEALRQQMRQRARDAIIGLPIVRESNRLLKQRLYDASARMTAAMDEVFDQINLTLRDVIREVAGGLDDKFDQMVGDVASTMATASINGYAKVRNDSLTELRLDLKAKLDVPDELKVHVYLLIRELSSENTPGGCLPASGKATEVSMGAKDIAVEWIFPGASIDLGMKFVFGEKPENGPLPLLGAGGGVHLTGEISFGESVIIHQLGASVFFGKFENYISGTAQVEVNGFQGGGGIFLGRTCTLDPFSWDETVQAVLGTPPFTGVYGYGEIWIPLNQIIGIPSSCLLNLSVGAGIGAGLFFEGPTIFGKMKLGVTGEVLCIVSITGEVILVGLARPTGLSLAGEGRFRATLGWCPICLKLDKTLRLVRESGKWSRKIK